MPDYTNDTAGISIRFEYNVLTDIMNYSRNINKLIPCSTSVMDFCESLELAGKLCPDDLKRALPFFRPSVISDEENTEHIEYFRFMDFDGEYQWYRIQARLVTDESGKITMIYGTYTPVDSKDETEKKHISEVADEMTGLYALAEFEKKIHEAYIADQEGVIINLILVHLDDYAEMRSLKGSRSADLALTEASRVLRSAVRSSDIVGRSGEADFIVALRGIRDVKVICDKAGFLIEVLANLWADIRPGVVHAVSVGIAIKNGIEEPEFDQMYENAKKALVAAIQRDKNGYVIHSGELRTDEQFSGSRAPLGDIDIIKNILDPIVAWAYAVDENYQLIYMNAALKDRFQGVTGGCCYEKLKGRNRPCMDCPMNLMAEEEQAADFDVYSPDLRAMEHVRATRIPLKNRRNAFVIADVNEDLRQQIHALEQSISHFNNAIVNVLDIVWEINLTKNVCTRIREENIRMILDQRVVDYMKFRADFLETAVYYEDREDFLQATEPGALRESRKIGRGTIEKQVRFMHVDGTYHWYDISTTVGADDVWEEDDLIYFSARDINALKNQMEQDAVIEMRYRNMAEGNTYISELAHSNERYEHVNELTGIFVFEYNVPTGDYYICTTFEEMFTLTEEMQRNEWSLLQGLEVYEDDKEKYLAFLKDVMEQPDTHEMTVRFINRYGVARWFTITVQTLNGVSNTLTRVLGILQDVNTEMEIKAELEFRADYDSLTRLFNSDAFYRRSAELLHLNPEWEFAMISVDVDRFRVINDRFGIKAGNKCLEYLGAAIAKSLKGGNIAGRYQADEFSVIFHYGKEQEIFDYIAGLTESFNFDAAKRCGSTLSYGIYMITKRDIPVRLMCDRARLAKQEIKGNTLTNFAVYDDKIRLQQRRISEMTSQMQIALDNGEFVMYLQPKIDLKTDKICGAEALVRWSHPTKGLHTPGEFIPLFESNGFVKKLDEYMWDSAASYLKRLQEIGKLLPISVNISRFHVNNTDLVRVLTGLTSRYGIEPRLLELEITETLFADNAEDLYATMQRLKDAGFIIEMDDFGSGYSSLNMLRQAPVDIIKIDRYFIDKIMATKRGRIIVENSVSMSRQLGMTVVAEGVETREQAEFLKSINCDIAQGYYYSKPVTVTEFERML
ncbi:MAG: EAL domain-containing protein [Lachnospiraceae bacterium]|nr:EAL domain-containing protein [Lachnospiraceae bacterium]